MTKKRNYVLLLVLSVSFISALTFFVYYQRFQSKQSTSLDSTISYKSGTSSKDTTTTTTDAENSFAFTKSVTKNSSTVSEVTIVIGIDGGCPQNCDTIHNFLPPEVKFRYDFFSNDDLDPLNLYSNLIIGTRFPQKNGKLSNWVRNYKIRTGKSVGLFLMADETHVVPLKEFTEYNYILHNYYRNYPMLGSGQLNSTIYWVMLLGYGNNAFTGHLTINHLPSSSRRNTCVWIGSLRADRQEMVDVMKKRFPDCDIQIESNFGGSVDRFHYQVRLANAKFGLNPRGNNKETHRLPELLSMGLIPVMRHAEFLDALERIGMGIPAVVVDTWEDAAIEMERLLKNPKEMDALQLKCIEWLPNYLSKAQKDMAVILNK